MKFPAHLCFGIVSLAFALLPTTARDDPSVKMIGVGLYGSNGHQLTPANFPSRSPARLVAVAAGRNTSPPETAPDWETASSSPSKTS